jgi:hypothetical protein
MSIYREQFLSAKSDFLKKLIGAQPINGMIKATEIEKEMVSIMDLISLTEYNNIYFRFLFLHWRKRRDLRRHPQKFNS